MAERTSIEWTDSTWNPIRGVVGKWTCAKVSPGCANCYAERLNMRFGGPAYAKGKDVARLDERALTLPLRWREPRRIFVCSMTDLFGEWVPGDWWDAIFDVMRRCPQHTFQVLTKRAERMAAYLTIPSRAPPPNVWVGVSVEDQRRADERIPHLLGIPATVRFLSCEPLLGPITFRPRAESLTEMVQLMNMGVADRPEMLAGIQWVIVGGESGPDHRPMDPAWARSLRHQCEKAGVAFFYKQGSGPRPGMHPELDGVEHRAFPSSSNAARAALKEAERDG